MRDTFRLRLIGSAVPEMLRHRDHRLVREIRKRRSSRYRNLLSRNDKKRSRTSMSSKKSRANSIQTKHSDYAIYYFPEITTVLY